MTNTHPWPKMPRTAAIIAISIMLIIGSITAVCCQFAPESKISETLIYTLPAGAVAGVKAGQVTPVYPTPYPTFSATVEKATPTEIIPQVTNTVDMVQNISANTEVAPIIRYIVITATPAPRTPRPSWTPTATVDFIAKYRALDYERARQVVWVRWVMVGVLFVTALAFTFCIIAGGIKTLRNREDPQPHSEFSPLPDVTVNDKRRDRWIITLHEEGHSAREIEEIIFGYTGGYAHHVVRRAIDNHSPTADEFHGEGVA